MAIEGRVLRPANENPWYVLMTLYGEQDGIDDDNVDNVLHSKNLEAWNLWACRALTTAIRDELTAANAVMPTEGDWNEREQEISSRFDDEMRRRNPTVQSVPTMPVPSLDPKLDNLLFEKKFVAQNFLFPVSASFNNSKFTKFVNFTNVKFIVIIEFEDAVFEREVRFYNALFGRGTNFLSTTFSLGARFDNADFYGIACRKGQRSGQPTSFGGPTSFQNTTFRNYADFHDVVFADEMDVNFSSANFESKAEFDRTTFGGGADFSKTAFKQESSFSLVTFFKETKFRSATFEQKAQFGDVKFIDDVTFIGTTFSERVSFLDAAFGQPGGQKSASFVDCQFEKPTSFRNAIFHSRFPDFSGTVLHGNTSFTDDRKHWPKVAPGNLEQDKLKQAKASCAVIRHSLGNQGLPEAEHFFFRREMGFAGRIGSWWERLPYQLFGWISDYGYSILTPFLWLCLLIVGGASVLAWGAQGGPKSLDFWQPLGLSFSNAFNFLGFHKTFQTETVMGNLTPLSKAFSGFQSIAGVVLLFFLGLGLRTRFRMR